MRWISPRLGSLDPQLVRKHQIYWDRLDEKIIALHLRIMTGPDIQIQKSWLYHH